MTTSRQKHKKDPQARLDYDIDLTPWMKEGDFVTACTWTIETIPGDTAPLTTDADSFTNFILTIWLLGGSLGSTYTVTAHFTTNEGREDDASLFMEIRNN